MRLMHLSDLHIGKRVNEFPMIKDQEYVFTEILGMIDSEHVDGVMIAGDVYDKSQPSAEAIKLFDDFLTRIAEKKIPVFVISGNHDSTERVAYGGRLMRLSSVYLAPEFNGKLEPVVLNDEYGEIAFYLLPFIKPANVRGIYGDDEITNYNDAVKAVIDHTETDCKRRNVIISHQFVTGAVASGSEDVSVGGVDNIDYHLFDAFDYAALGHIHGAQRVGRDTVRYGGTPLKYSFSEVSQKKVVTIVDIKEKGNVEIHLLPLSPMHDMREIRGTYMELTARDFYKDTAVDDYLHVILTDEEETPDVIGKLRSIYPNIMRVEYDNTRTSSSNSVAASREMLSKSPVELFGDLYKLQNNREMTDEQIKYTLGIIDRIWGDEN